MGDVRYAAVAWGLILVAFWGTVVIQGWSPADLTVGAVQAATEGPWRLAILAAVYLARSVLLLPMSILTVFAGFALGPWLGSAVAITGALGSSLATYGLARFAGARREWPQRVRPPKDAADEGALAAWAERMRRSTFESVLVARALAMPGDAVNVAAGAGRAPVLPFAAATVLGSLPGMIAMTLAGASMEGAFTPEGLRLRWDLLAASAALAVVGVAVSLWLRRRRAATLAAEDAADDASQDASGGATGS